jgi:hypothetical protein
MGKKTLISDHDSCPRFPKFLALIFIEFSMAKLFNIPNSYIVSLKIMKSPQCSAPLVPKTQWGIVVWQIST